MTDANLESDDALNAFLNAGRPQADDIPEVACPMCGAANSGISSECAACGEALNPVVTESGAWRDGKMLVMNRFATLPYRCVVTNEAAVEFLPQTIAEQERDAFAAFLIGRLLGFPFAQTTSQFKIQLPVSKQGLHRQRFRGRAALMMGIGGSIFLVLLLFLMSRILPEMTGPLSGISG